MLSVKVMAVPTRHSLSGTLRGRTRGRPRAMASALERAWMPRFSVREGTVAAETQRRRAIRPRRDLIMVLAIILD
jgi:hypothetical protein